MGGGGKRQSGSSCALLGEGEHAGDLHIEEREYAYLRATGESATMDICMQGVLEAATGNFGAKFGAKFG
jgi:hypothetical protein